MCDSIILVLCHFVEDFGVDDCCPSELELLDCIFKGFLLQGAMIGAWGPSEVILDGALADEACLLQLNDILVIDLWILTISLYLCFTAICRRAIRAELFERDDSLSGVTLLVSLLVNAFLFPIHIKLGLLALELIERLDEIIKLDLARGMHVGLEHIAHFMLLIERLGTSELSEEEPAVLKLQPIVILLAKLSK